MLMRFTSPYGVNTSKSVNKNLRRLFKVIHFILIRNKKTKRNGKKYNFTKNTVPKVGR